MIFWLQICIEFNADALSIFSYANGPKAAFGLLLSKASTQQLLQVCSQKHSQIWKPQSQLTHSELNLSYGN